MADPRRVLEAQLRSATIRLGRAELANGEQRGDEADLAGATELRILVGAGRERPVSRRGSPWPRWSGLDAGTWGRCLACGEAIAPRRLAYALEVEHCIACAEALELLAKRDGAGGESWESDEE